MSDSNPGWVEAAVVVADAAAVVGARSDPDTIADEMSKKSTAVNSHALLPFGGAGCPSHRPGTTAGAVYRVYRRGVSGGYTAEAGTRPGRRGH